MYSKKLSVIVPVYNSQNFIVEALECLRNQTINSAEFIIVNDGSTDDSDSLIRATIINDRRFVYILKPSNTGYGSACNVGIENSVGEFIAIFEPDDLIPEDFYDNLLVKAKEAPRVDIVKYNGIYKFHESPKNKERLFRLKNFPCSVFFGYEYPRFWIAHPCTINAIYRRDFLEKNNIRYVQGVGASYQDVQFVVALFYGNPSILLLNDCKYLYRQHQNQSINQANDMILDAVIKNWQELFLNSKNISEDNSWFAVVQMYRHFKSLEHRFSKKCFRLWMFYSSILIGYRFPKISELKWFGFGRKDIVIFYFFSIKILSISLLNRFCVFFFRRGFFYDHR